jgi:hypothetical protein
MKIFAIVATSLIFLPQCFAQAKASAPRRVADPDRLGHSCAQVLQMTSSDWVAYFKQNSGQPVTPDSGAVLRAIAAYAKCYDERTRQLAATLGKSGHGPLMGANGNFRDFDSALEDFTTKALVATKAAADSEKSAYAHLYLKQFRYRFYQSYLDKDVLTRPLSAEESDDYAKAKNHFGEVLGLLPDDQLHSVHAAFRQIFDLGPVSEVTKLALYRFAIFLLAPPKDKPFSPPPL